jgi:excinuclease UvrABC nuclease subunit
MSAGQLWLFDPPKPLVERLGEEFFAGLPTGPGVYLMCGAQEGVLYVGKARNLRKRLSSYRVANPERLPRRTIRLLHQVRRIEWDECVTEQAASEREEMLICVLAPKFNAVGKVREIRRAGAVLNTEVWRGKSKNRLVAAAAQFIVESARVPSKT